MRLIPLFLLLSTLAYSQVTVDQQSACKCTVKRLSGDRERGSVRLVVTDKTSDKFTLMYDGDSWLADSSDYAVYQEFTLNRIFSYPYLFLTHEGKIYKLDIEEERLYVGNSLIGKAQNATEAFELLTTQILLPQECPQAHVTFTAVQSRNIEMPLPLLPGRLYN